MQIVNFEKYPEYNNTYGRIIKQADATHWKVALDRDGGKPKIIGEKHLMYIPDEAHASEQHAAAERIQSIYKGKKTREEDPRLPTNPDHLLDNDGVARTKTWLNLPDDRKFELGQRVMIINLAGPVASQYNGTTGTIMEFNQKQKRWKVACDRDQGRPKLLRVGHLTVDNVPA